jgi:putative hydrolase of the HAD superfamily
MERPGRDLGRRLSISFDLDGTLTDPAFVDGVWNEGLPRLVADSRGIDLTEAAKLCVDAYRSEGEASILWYRLSHWLDHFGLHDVDEEDLIDGFTPRIRIFEDAIRAIEHFKAEGYPLVLFSNAPRVFLNKEVHYCSLKDSFDTIISLPDDWDMVKSQDEAFLRLKSHVPGEVIHVGDHIRFDCEVPRMAGLKAYHIWRGKGPRLNDSLESLDQFVDRIMCEQVQP